MMIAFIFALCICVFAVSMSVVLVVYIAEDVIREQELRHRIAFNTKTHDYPPDNELNKIIDQAVALEPEFENCGTYAPIDKENRFWPWHAVIYYDETLKKDRSGYIQVCAGTLITRRHLISHCRCFLYTSITGLPNIQVLDRHHIILGKLEDDPKTVSANEQMFIAKSVKPGARGNKFNTSNAIALLTTSIENAINFTFYVRPICLSLNITRELTNMKFDHKGIVPYFANSSDPLHPPKQAYEIIIYKNCSRVYKNDNWTQLPIDIYCGFGDPDTRMDICTKDLGSGYAAPEPSKDGETKYFLRGVFTSTVDKTECSRKLHFIHITSRSNRELLLYDNVWFKDDLRYNK